MDGQHAANAQAHWAGQSGEHAAVHRGAGSTAIGTHWALSRAETRQHEGEEEKAAMHLCGECSRLAGLT